MARSPARENQAAYLSTLLHGIPRRLRLISDTYVYFGPHDNAIKQGSDGSESLNYSRTATPTSGGNLPVIDIALHGRDLSVGTSMAGGNLHKYCLTESVRTSFSGEVDAQAVVTSRRMERLGHHSTVARRCPRALGREGERIPHLSVAHRPVRIADSYTQMHWPEDRSLHKTRRTMCTSVLP